METTYKSDIQNNLFSCKDSRHLSYVIFYVNVIYIHFFLMSYLILHREKHSIVCNNTNWLLYSAFPIKIKALRGVLWSLLIFTCSHSIKIQGNYFYIAQNSN